MEDLWDGGVCVCVCEGGVLCTNPQEIQSERVEGEDLPQEEGGG